MSFPKDWLVSEALDFDADFCNEAEIAAFVAAVKDGQTPNPDNLRRIALALEQIELGRDAQAALGVKRASHRPKKRELSAREEREELAKFRAVRNGATYQEAGLEKNAYYNKRKHYAAILESEAKLEHSARLVVAAYEFICRELALSESEKTALNNFSMRGILEFSEKVKTAGISDTVRLKDFLLKHS